MSVTCPWWRGSGGTQINTEGVDEGARYRVEDWEQCDYCRGIGIVSPGRSKFKIICGGTPEADEFWAEMREKNKRIEQN